ncbi:MAG TPA: alpha-ketoglutarate-dependent dioxygenase AlkB [Oceanospirillales bacterium]|nr:alpha-ketoglutarate-dependent dioxygenase AlkB [Pseudomonadota bacterium]MED5439840.1 alpha-ketoglutarate-dependent dioxygenase AlkB [Pseudomonadota bacterium]MEE3191113.1 alpha-ketoglutarate-dependent dioxygenase AlkB [Pseudomonadota bacterium]MEE3210599.1 alpha-ketoglutarate-dependent dioxygenase AlkB [Pseudomonadota bacterium]HCG79197.1 alpha-ketoglutarate-dependent dioxygenase AlkB [Oceanospirillales bacterium]
MADLFGQSMLLDGSMEYFPQWLSSHESDSLLSRLQSDIAWQQPSITIYGKRHPIPRLQAWMGNRAHTYRYSGTDFTSVTWPDYLASLAKDLSQIAGVEFNSVLLNLYRNGQDSMGWHSDDEPELGETPVIASLSLGAERDFTLRPSGATRQAHSLPLQHGSLLIMKAGMQSDWQHALPRRARVSKPRINLTFRKIIAA